MTSTSCCVQNVTVAAFDNIAPRYDSTFTDSLIGRAQREAVWRIIDRSFQRGSKILEINCGTGVDAIHLASREIKVLACDASPAMLKVARQRIDGSIYKSSVELLHLPTEDLKQLIGNHGPFDGVLSNFSGLNCVGELRPVAQDLANLTKPGGKVAICIFGRVCAWEILWYVLKGSPLKAVRRLRRHPSASNIAGGKEMTLQYPSVTRACREFRPHFQILEMRGVGILVPPSYMEDFVQRRPYLLRAAQWMDRFLSQLPGIRLLADHTVLVFERRFA